MLSLLDNSVVCPGDPDEQFMEMAKAKKGNLLSRDGKRVESDDDSPGMLNGDTYQVQLSWISVYWLAVVNVPKCVSFRSTLRMMRHRWSKQKSLTLTHHQSSITK